MEDMPNDWLQPFSCDWIKCLWFAGVLNIVGVQIGTAVYFIYVTNEVISGHPVLNPTTADLRPKCL